MKYFLDSNIIIYFIKGKFRTIGEMLEAHDRDIVIPSVVLAELEYGARNSNDYEKTISVYKPFLDLYPTAVFDKKSSVEYGKLRKILSSNGVIIGPNDMMIAATVLANGGTLINNPDASVGVCCSHKVVAVGFNTLCYDASVGVLNPPHE